MITIGREKLEQVLEALTYCEALNSGVERQKMQARNAIQEALAQPAQEPVAWGVDWSKAGDIPCVSIIKRLPDGGIEVLAVEYGPPRRWVGLTDGEIDECDLATIHTCTPPQENT